MERAITGYHTDEVGDWVAELACGHNQHVRHRPPLQLRAWILEPAERASRAGTPLDCPLCDRAELPETERWVRTTPIWDERTLPAGLRRAHRIAAGTWGLLVVQQGRLRFRAMTTPVIEVELGANATQGIPPEVDHEVAPLGSVRFSVEFYVVDRGGGTSGVDEAEEPAEEGGDPACWAGLVCPECGAVVDGGRHRAGCPVAK